MRCGPVELRLIRVAEQPPAGERETEALSKRARLRRFARRRWLPVVAVVALLGLPGTVAAMSMAGGEPEAGDPEADWGASILDPDDAEFVQANWERAMAIEPIYDDGLDLEDAAMEPLAGALGANGIPEVALDAYYNAEDTVAGSDPSCVVPWSLVAAIGRVESNHGRFGGAQLLEGGYGTRPIRGVALDGRPGVALIRDTDDGALDDDPVYDRAVGPMQFIPSSWPPVASDGNADDMKDPDNIYDASIGTAVYLCAGNGDLLDDPDARYAAVFRYNHSDEYVRTVLSLAEMYDESGVFEVPPPRTTTTTTPPATVPPTTAPRPTTTTSTTSTTVPGSTTTTVPGSTTTVPGSTTTVPWSTTTTEPGPEPAPAEELPVLELPPTDPISVGWPQGMNELPPAQLPPAPAAPVPLDQQHAGLDARQPDGDGRGHQRDRDGAGDQ